MGYVRGNALCAVHWTMLNATHLTISAMGLPSSLDLHAHAFDLDPPSDKETSTADTGHP
jgi:hypothetical protein